MENLWISGKGPYMLNDNATAYPSNVYDTEVLKTIPFYLEFHLETIDLIRTVRPDVGLWLDTGSGTGYLPQLALARFPDTRFLLADPSQAMLDIARVRLTRFGARIAFAGVLRSEELASAVTEAPQVVTAIQCHHYGDREARRRATLACRQVLAPGGVYVTFENIRPESPQAVQIALERWLRFQREAGRSAEEVEEHRLRFDRDFFPITVAEHLELLREAGFATVGVFWLSQMQAGFYAIK